MPTQYQRLIGTVSSIDFRHRCGWTIAAQLLVMIAGCGSHQDPNRLPVFPAKGQINFKGQAPAGAFVVLHPKGAKVAPTDAAAVRPRAYVRPDGTFELTSYESNDGAPAGEYAVTLEWRKLVRFPSGDAGPGPNLAPRQYSRPETSPVTVRIAEGKNELPPIVLK